MNINSVLGSGISNPEDALAVATRALNLGFTSTVGIIHDGHGQLQPLGPREKEIFEEIMSLGKRSFTRVNGFQHNIAAGRENKNGGVAPVRATSTSARTVLYTTARSSAAIPASRLYTPTRSATANLSRKRAALPGARSPCVHQISFVTAGALPQRDTRFHRITRFIWRPRFPIRSSSFTNRLATEKASPLPFSWQLANLS